MVVPSVTGTAVQGWTEISKVQSEKLTGVSGLSDPGLVSVSSEISYEQFFSMTGRVMG